MRDGHATSQTGVVDSRGRQRNKLITATRIALIWCVLFAPGWAVAQRAGGGGGNRMDSRAARISDQQDAIDAATQALQEHESAGQPAPPAPKEFNFRITAPIYYNSNAQERHVDGTGTIEGDPALELGWSRNLTSVPLKISVKLQTDTDRYANVPRADEDEISGIFKAQYYDAQDDQALAPFVSSKTSLLFHATYSPWKQTKNDFNVGLVKVFNFDADLNPLPASARSSANAVWSLTLTTAAQRRVRTPGPDSTAMIGVVAVGYSPLKSVTMLLGVDNTQRWYDSFIVRKRLATQHEFKTEPVLTILWDTSSILAGLPQVGLQIGFEHQSSNIVRRTYNQWTVGPFLTANWRF